MFWAYRPPSFTFPTMRLEALSAVSAKILKVLLLATKNLSQYRAFCLWYENFSGMSNHRRSFLINYFMSQECDVVGPRRAGQAPQSVSAGSHRQPPSPDFEA
jgi:hypothetical protein